MAACIGERIEVRRAGAEPKEGPSEADSDIRGPTKLRCTEHCAEGRSEYGLVQTHRSGRAQAELVWMRRSLTHWCSVTQVMRCSAGRRSDWADCGGTGEAARPWEPRPERSAWYPASVSPAVGPARSRLLRRPIPTPASKAALRLPPPRGRRLPWRELRREPDGPELGPELTSSLESLASNRAGA